MAELPKPQAPREPRLLLDSLPELEREEQIRVLEDIHSELVTRLNRAQG